MKMRFAFLALLILSCTACSKKKDASSTSTDISETAQQVGDAMASADEMGGAGGGYAMFTGERKLFARVTSGRSGVFLSSLLVPEAEAAACTSLTGWGACSGNTLTRNFGSGCTIGGATITGTVTITFTDNANLCRIDTAGETATREPSLTLTGRRGGTLTITKTGTNGQVVTRNGDGTFSFTNDGIRRVISFNGTTLFDFTTQTTSAITISGATRATRTMNGGTLRVTNNSSAVTCDYSPSNLAWTGTCNCPTSGSWSGTCSDGKSSTVTITGCGAASYTLGSETESMSFDRCQSI